MRNPNTKIILIAIILIAAVAAAGLWMNPELFAKVESVPEGSAQAYLRVQVGDQVWEPIALADGDEYTIAQPDGKTNVVHVTATGAVMHSSTCDNQSCVEQGEVTLENRDTRVLTNMITYLPNQVILEVLTPQEAGMEAAQ